MDLVEAAILRTVLYADVFNFPLTLEEIHHFLICDDPISLETVQQTFDQSPELQSTLICSQGYVACKGRDDLISVRVHREKASSKLWPLALKYGTWLASIPFVRMVALTGALAVRNVPDDDDDLDYLLVTTPGRVWIARACAILLVRLVRLRGVEICPNFILAENKLEQKRQDIFTAHEVAQMIPLYGLAVYRRMRAVNGWSEKHLPNAEGVFYAESGRQIGMVRQGMKRAFELILGGRIGDTLEHWEYQRKLQRFQPALESPNSSAQIDDTQVKGHFNDNGHPALQKYFARLREYGLDEMQVRIAGD